MDATARNASNDRRAAASTAGVNVSNGEYTEGRVAPNAQSQPSNAAQSGSSPTAKLECPAGFAQSQQCNAAHPRSSPMAQPDRSRDSYGRGVWDALSWTASSNCGCECRIHADRVRYRPRQD